MPRAKTNGNGHKQSKIEDFEMVSTPVQTEHEAIALPQEITWEEALKFTGCQSRALLVLRLAPMLPEVDVDGLTTISLAFKPQLEQIKEQIESESTKSLGASIPPIHQLQPSVEIPLIEESQALVKADELPKPTKGRGRPKKTDQLKESQELVVKEVKAIQTATTQRKSKAKSNAEEGKRTRQVKGRLRAVAEIAIEQSAYEEVLEAFENKRSEEIDTELTEFLEDINASLKASGAKVQVLTDDQIEDLKAESVAAEEAQDDFLSATVNLWG